MRDFTSWKGLTKNNHISAIYGDKPQLATSVMVRLMESNYGKSLESYLAKFPTKYFEEDADFVWQLIGSSRKNIPLYEARDLSGNVITVSDMAGANTEPFYLVFQEDWFADGNVVVGEKNEIYPLRILGDPRIEGTLYIYKVELMGGVTSGMPGEELLMGKRFSDDYSPVEKEMSRKVGDVRFSAPISMRNEFSRIRIQHKAPGSMLNKKVAAGIPVKDDKTGKVKVLNYWMHHVDWAIEEQFANDKNYCIIYGRSNRTSTGEYKNFGKSGNVLQTGAGIREQMEYANTHYYNEFSIRLIEDALFELSTGVLDFKNRVFVLETGERGAAAFSKAVLDTVSGWQAFSYLRGGNHPGVISSTSSELHSNALSAGFQFVEYKAPNGVVVKVNVNPMYDDPVRNKLDHPDGGKAESYRYDIYYIGNPDEPNIQLAKIRGDEDIRGIQRGLRDPFTGRKGGDMAYDEDSAVIHRYAALGALVLDPNRTMSLIPSILAQ